MGLINLSDPDLGKSLPILRMAFAGSSKELDRSRYLRLLHAQDRAFLRLLDEFGESSPAELRDLARSVRSKRFAFLTEPTVVDWLGAAQKRGFVQQANGERGLWSLTEEGRTRGQGWRRHVAPRSIAGFVKWLVPLILAAAAAGFAGDIYWGALGKAEELLTVAAILGFVVFLILYTMLIRVVQAYGAVVLIEATRMAGKELHAEVTPAIADTG